MREYLSSSRISIKVIPKPAKSIDKLLDEVHRICRNENYSLVALVVDRDTIKDFDQKVSNATSVQVRGKKIQVGWSNPCIETWFSAYFCSLVSGNTPQECIDKFKRIFRQKTGHDYTKINKDLYSLLKKMGKRKRSH